VMVRSQYIAEKEGVWEDEIELLCIAALFHDTGFVIEYDNNEAIGAKIAQNYLRTVLYPEEKIRRIQELIMATDPEVEPRNLLEKIIKDADMDNLWRDDFFDISEKLKLERETIKRIKIKDPEWHHASLDIVQWHRFYTPTQIQERNEKLQKNLEKLREKLQK
jgi:HD superfamily phosphodiesterase